MITKTIKKRRKSAPKNRWHSKAVYLPKSLVTRINLLNDSDFFANEKEYWRCIKLLGRIYKTYENNYFQYSVDLPQSYVKTIVSSDGMKMWGKLRMEEDILIMVRNQSTIKKQSKSFIINPIYMQGEPVRLKYKEVGKKLQPFERKVVNILKRTTLELPQTIEETVFAKEEKFKESTIRRIDMDKKIYTPSKGRKFKIEGDVSYFIEKEVARKGDAEKERLASIAEGRWRASRNITNFRLDTNYTNLNEEYKQYIRIDGKSVKFIDLSNSQFCIFSNLLYAILYNEDTLYRSIEDDYVNDFIIWCKIYTMGKDIDKEDLHRFCQASFKGQLYETLADDLGVDTSIPQKKRRAIAKKYAFHLFFSNVSFNGEKELKEELRKHYPTIVDIVDIVDEYKKHSTFDESRAFYEDRIEYKSLHRNKSHMQVGSNNFSRVLQIIESWIFIDQLYTPLVEKEEPVLSIHDSFGYPFDFEIDLNEMDVLLPFGYKLTIRNSEVETLKS